MMLRGRLLPLAFLAITFTIKSFAAAPTAPQVLYHQFGTQKSISKVQNILTVAMPGNKAVIWLTVVESKSGTFHGLQFVQPSGPSCKEPQYLNGLVDTEKMVESLDQRKDLCIFEADTELGKRGAVYLENVSLTFSDMIRPPALENAGEMTVKYMYAGSFLDRLSRYRQFSLFLYRDLSKAWRLRLNGNIYSKKLAAWIPAPKSDLVALQLIPNVRGDMIVGAKSIEALFADGTAATIQTGDAKIDHF